jgi:cell division inhibitor SepF
LVERFLAKEITEKKIMGIFDLFGKEPKTRNERMGLTQFEDIKHTEQSADKAGPVAVFSPTSYSDVEVIIDTIKSGKNVMVHLTELKTETAIRVLDMLSGAIYALNGGVYEMGKNIFMFSPSGVEVF